MIELNKVTRLSTAVAVLLYLGTFILAFYLGMLWNKFTYTDICLDIGGGMNPGGYAICVIEK